MIHIHFADKGARFNMETDRALIYFVQQRNMTKYIGSCIAAQPLNLKAQVW